MAANNIKNFFGPSDIEPIIQGLGSTLQDNAINSLDFCSLMSSLSGSCYGSTWFDFVYDYVDEDIVKNIVINESDGFYLADLLLTNDRRSLNKVAANFPDLISDVLRNTEDLDFSTYLFYIYKKFGRTVFNQVLDDVGTITLQKTLTLDELHIYGSSRHGIKKPKTRLVAKIFALDEIESDGEFSYGAGSDSTFAKINYHYFKRTLTYKQYELTNHLGNVLATIIDRKTPQISSGNVSYYEADVTTAQMYYAFGSAIKELSYAYSSGGDTSKYRYGFNGQEKDNEISGDGNSYTAEFWEYDSRLGRRFNMDPRTNPSMSNYVCFSNNPLFYIDKNGDTTRVYNIQTGVLIESLDDGKTLYTDYKVNNLMYQQAKMKATSDLMGPGLTNEYRMAYFNSRFKENSNDFRNIFFTNLENTARSIENTISQGFLVSPRAHEFYLRYGVGILFAKENSNSLTFNGGSLTWNTTFTDGTSKVKYSWGAESGNRTASEIPNGNWTAYNPVRTPESGMSYSDGWGFKVFLRPEFDLCADPGTDRDAFRIHPDGNRATAPGTAGCIGLIDGESVCKIVYQIFVDYLTNGATMTVNVNDPNNINDGCQDNGVNDEGAPGE